jgi:Zn finger protein HypA/HybF involved in hydrogenase expression
MPCLRLVSDMAHAAQMGRLETGKCWCENCAQEAYDAIEGVEKKLEARMMLARMFLCPVCGNKRCSMATDHLLTCGFSNDPGQWGSSYEE